MINSQNQLIKNILDKWREKAILVACMINRLALVLSVILILYRYGFYLSDVLLLELLSYTSYLLNAFALAFFISWVFAFKSIRFFKRSWLEGSLSIFILLNTLANYFLDLDFNVLIIQAYWGEEIFFIEQIFLTFYLLIYVALEGIRLTNAILAKSSNPSLLFTISFIFLIGSGTGILLLPTMTEGSQSMPFIDALFTAVSASCVTGLAIADTGAYFTLKGHLVIMSLIQLGGIGIVSFATFFATFLAKGVGLKQQSVIQDMLSSESLISARDLLKKIILITVSIEILGATAIFFSWDENLQFNHLWQKIFHSIFYSVSAFCNAGFSLVSDSLYTSKLSDGTVFNQINMDINLRKMYELHIIVACLIILGGIGFGTIEDIFQRSRKRWITLRDPIKWKLSTRIAIYSTIFLILLGTLGFMILEFEQLSQVNIFEALNYAFFQSVTTRTAGFNSMEFSTLKDSTLILCMFLMFIGAAPGSTGGGIKCSTFYIIINATINSIQGQKNIVIHKRTIPQDNIHKAYSVFIFATTYNLIAIFVLSISESSNSNVTILQLAFEQVSAFATAGLSTGITSDLTTFGKIIIIISMYIGRVGTLTLALALNKKEPNNNFTYPQGHVMVG